MPGGMPRCIVTTSLRAHADQLELAVRISREIGAPLVARNKKAIKKLSEEWNVSGVVVVDANKVAYITGENEFFFHPSMAVLRIKEIKSGKNDQMISAMKLSSGQRVLDCTLGLGTDAIVTSYVLGTEGVVVGLESSPVIAAIVRTGLQSNYKKVGRDVLEAMRRVKVKCADHGAVLAELPENSFDVVYFDPMFRLPRLKSSGINALRPLADHRPLTPEVIKLAMRVAAKRVVVKEGRRCNELRQLGFEHFVGGTNAPVIYGVMVKGK
ncbi:class I SAM-dependent methyltransferase [Desulfallas sp. Bu1-1]|uniref:class I SAM-dependent methyltransferase n=1 Tax=Desulfallas sp. Bu1-1 TaxID=2787620 RepID=UPI001FACDEE5|nr:class I SAM-dependent methyltransferase [Desulfallas sp. Bu1-1]